MKPLVLTLSLLAGTAGIVLLAVGTAQWLAVALMVLALVGLSTTVGGAAGAVGTDQF